MIFTCQHMMIASSPVSLRPPCLLSNKIFFLVLSELMKEKRNTWDARGIVKLELQGLCNLAMLSASKLLACGIVTPR
eukprot:01800_1